MVVIPRGGRVGGAVTLPSRLHPNECVLQRVASVGGEGLTEAGANDVAPVAPLLLLGWLDSVTAGVCDEVCWVGYVVQKRCERVDVEFLVVGLAALSVWWSRADIPGVVVRNVGG